MVKVLNLFTQVKVQLVIQINHLVKNEIKVPIVYSSKVEKVQIRLTYESKSTSNRRKEKKRNRQVTH